MKNPRYLGLRSVLETPIMDDRKWAKIPEIPADGFLIDMEDSVPPPLKEAARARVVEYLGRPEYFGGRLTIARPNHLDTPWGRDDIEALAEANVRVVALPKLASLDELLEIRALFAARGADPDIFAAIETARGMFAAADIAAAEKVVGIGIGVGDLSADMGVPLYDRDGELNQLFVIAKSQIALAGAAFGCVRGETAFTPDLRDLDDVRRRYELSRGLGFNLGFAFYPPHVGVINEVYGVSEGQLAEADEIIGLYETAIAAGDAAVQLESGRAVLVHDYQKALQVRARYAAVADGAPGNL